MARAVGSVKLVIVDFEGGEIKGEEVGVGDIVIDGGRLVLDKKGGSNRKFLVR